MDEPIPRNVDEPDQDPVSACGEPSEAVCLNESTPVPLIGAILPMRKGFTVEIVDLRGVESSHPFVGDRQRA